MRGNLSLARAAEAVRIAELLREKRADLANALSHDLQNPALKKGDSRPVISLLLALGLAMQVAHAIWPIYIYIYPTCPQARDLFLRSRSVYLRTEARLAIALNATNKGEQLGN
jgi:hypothetical protein